MNRAITITSAGTTDLSILPVGLSPMFRRSATAKYGATRGEIGWVLDDNQGMNAIADAIESRVNKVYQIYEKPL